MTSSRALGGGTGDVAAWGDDSVGNACRGSSACVRALCESSVFCVRRVEELAVSGRSDRVKGQPHRARLCARLEPCRIERQSGRIVEFVLAIAGYKS